MYFKSKDIYENRATTSQIMICYTPVVTSDKPYDISNQSKNVQNQCEIITDFKDKLNDSFFYKFLPLKTHNVLSR